MVHRVGGGIGNTATANHSTVGGGSSNTALTSFSTVAGGRANTASGGHSTIGGGDSNLVAGHYSAILGGYADTITAAAGYSYLFGIGSKLTQDSTFMVDMPHIRFGDETNGYEFPTSDGGSGQVMATDGSGQLSWVDPAGGGGGWTDDGTVVRLETDTDSVGVGTATPTEKLDVAGNIHASGTITSGASITIDGNNDEITSTSNRISFGNDTLVTTGKVMIGATESVGSQLLLLSHSFNTTEASFGIYARTHNFGTGNLFGVCTQATGLGGGHTTGLTAYARSDGYSRTGVDGYAGTSDTVTTGITTGVQGGAQYGPNARGVYGNAGNATTGYGVKGHVFNCTTGYGVYGFAHNNSTNWAGYFDGDVNITGTLYGGKGSSKIDHPHDPENKYLYHSFVESPDMMNVYNGNVIIDANGEATVQLPDYFEAINTDFRYQLTAIGAPGPNLYIAEEISGNSFTIAGGEPGMKVSWQVTGIRKDPFAEANRIQVEVDKPTKEQGKYLHPEAYGLGEEYGIHYEEHKRMEEELQEENARKMEQR